MKDNEWAGVGNSEEFKFRGLDTRIGRFRSIDPITSKYPWNSSYAYAENDVIRCKDLEGLEKDIYTITRTNKDGTEIKTVTKKTLEKQGPLGPGTAVILNKDGVTKYMYGENSTNTKDFVSHYEGRQDKVYPSLEGGAPTGGIGHKLNDANEQKSYPVGTQLSDKTIDIWYTQDWSDKSNIVENNGSTSQLSGGQKEAVTDFVFNGLKASSFSEGDDETFFLRFLKGSAGTVKKRIGELILFRDNRKVNLEYVKDKKRQQELKKLNQ